MSDSNKFETVRLEDVGEIITGSTPPTQDESNYGGDVPFVRVSDMPEDSPYLKSTNKKLTVKGLNSVKNRELTPGSVMISCIGSLGKTVVVEDTCVTNQQINSIRPSEDVDVWFLYYKLSQLQPKLEKIAGGTAQPIISKTKLSGIEIAIPELHEQEKIGQFLRSIDEKIEVNRAMGETLEDIAHAIYTSWFVDYEPYTSKEHPENHQSVSTLGEFINGYAFSQDKVTNSGEPVIKIRELKNGVSDNSDYYPEDENVDEKYHLSSGDVLFSWSASLDVFLWKKDVGLLNQHIYNVRPSEEFGREFVYFSLKQALAHLENRADGTTMSHINRSDLDEVSVECLTPEIRKRFTETVRPLMNEIIRLDQENESLAELRDYLLPQLLSGEVRLGGDNA